MDQSERIQAALNSATDFSSFTTQLLADCLCWPFADKPIKPQDVGYEWSANELGMPETGHKAKAYEILLRPRADQPWGIFLLEFDEPKVFETRGFGTPLRAVLRRLVAGKRKEPNLPSWGLGNILFICTHDYQQYVFAAFRDQFGTGKVADARLATFGWNKGQPCRTVVTQNLPHLCWPEDAAEKDAWLSEWARAFDKQPLTDTFFKAFNKALEAIKTDLEKLGKLDSPEAYSKAQLLLERLIFLYFVQNRGWLNRNRDFLKDGFKPHRAKPKECTYYSQFLEKLFWSLSYAGHGSYERWEHVPFLNGGLFDDDEFEPSTQRESKNPPLKVRNSTFAAIFDEFLEAFNFTVREDTPLNQDVAVDPEMLGKVFESIVLHAEKNDPFAPDQRITARDARKQSGSYYTPRIVVHFICREVLYQLLQPKLAGADWPRQLRALLEFDASDGFDQEGLKTLKQLLSAEEGTRMLVNLRSLRCCDPAVGSGAFMVGLLHDLTNLRRLAQTAANGYVDPVSKDRKWLHDTKADIIANCLYGVDIQQQAIEICMLRLWLSLVVDYDLGLNPFEAEEGLFLKELAGVSQLPNLEMNFKRGDSLHDYICGVPVVIRPHGQYGDLYAEIGRLGRILHSCGKAAKKHEYRLKILRKRIELARRVIQDTLKDLRQELDSDIVGIFGVPVSKAKRKQHIDHETALLSDALDRLVVMKEELTKLEATPKDPLLVLKLRKLEGADFDAPFNFAWRIDFPQVFWPEVPKTTLNGKLALGNELKGQMDLAAPMPSRGGFDIVVGNPPFVTAKNEEKRSLYRERWQPYCHMKYHMLVPFFPLCFGKHFAGNDQGLMKAGGQLGFIVSNAFAKREFGKPLVEQFLTKVDLQKVVDCSGLMFPGHGTPTFVVFGSNAKPAGERPVANICTLPGGGDLHAEPEESPLWHSIEAHHTLVDTGRALDGPERARGFRAAYEDLWLAVGACDRRRYLKHPCSWVHPEWPTLSAIAEVRLPRLRDFLPGDLGVSLVTGANEVYAAPPDTLRRSSVEQDWLVPYVTGENVRNWQWDSPELAVFPYSHDHRLRNIRESRGVLSWLSPFRSVLSQRIYFGKTPADRGLQWYEYAVVVWTNCDNRNKLVLADLATHAHMVRETELAAFNQHMPVLALSAGSSDAQLHVVSGTLNSSSALFWLKQVCFNKGAGEDEERDRFEFAGGKVEQLPVPDKVAQALRGEWHPLAKRLAEMAEECWNRGQEMPSLSMKKLFEKPGEAYHEWNSSLPGYEKPHPVIGKPFGSADELKQVRDRTIDQREKLRREMVALQEEMDWLVYAAYSLLPEDHPAVSFRPSEAHGGISPDPLDKDQRPYRLWQQAEGDFAKAVGLISSNWADARKRLWRERLAAIRDNEHIRRIEQPVYKRRWDEQWKVKNRWECGPVAYEQELTDAFDWWLLEKAEWYLEHKKDGGPAELSAWAQGLWRDPRIQAAVEVVDHSLAGPEGFIRLLREKVDEESVPEGIPFAKPWEELEKKFPKSELNKARKIRGKLNVPRERFHLVSKGVYAWAGLLFR